MRFKILFILFFSQSVLAWGPVGHRVVGAVAEKHLTPSAKKMVHQLLGNLTLADSTTWADEVRSNPAYDFYAPFHYVSVPDKDKYEANEKNENVIEGIKTMMAKLNNKKLSKEVRAEALKFLAHFIGDIHQPLHVGRAEDRGGNNIEVLWFGKSQKLHWIWDVSLIEQEALTYSELAQWVNYPHKEDKEWLKSDVMGWAQESQALRPLVYAFKDAFMNEIEIAEVLKKPIPEKFSETPKLSYQYFGRAKPILRQRLYQAGIRLAKVINEAAKK